MNELTVLFANYMPWIIIFTLLSLIVLSLKIAFKIKNFWFNLICYYLFLAAILISFIFCLKYLYLKNLFPFNF